MKRYFLFHYITKTTMGTMSHGNVKVADYTFPSELWLKEVAIPEMLQKQMSPAHFDILMQGTFVIVGFFEFRDEADFLSFIGGHDMNDQIGELFS